MMEVLLNSDDDIGTFNLLPDEMIVYSLSFFDVDTLLNCRLVCKRWKELIDAYVFQEKASRQNDIVNNGRGYYSFSQIDSNTVRKLDLPWYVFYAICKYDPFHRNLIRNNCGQDEYKYWTIPPNHNWSIEQTPQGTCELPNDPDFGGYRSCFVTTYRVCSKSQLIILKNYGLTKKIIKCLRPDILISDWYSGRFDCSSKYSLRITVHDYNNTLLEQYNYNDILIRGEANKWIKTTHLFQNQYNVCNIVLHHSGVDTQYWAGHYGAKISGTVIKILLPIKLKHVE